MEWGHSTIYIKDIWFHQKITLYLKINKTYVIHRDR